MKSLWFPTWTFLLGMLFWCVTHTDLVIPCRHPLFLLCSMCPLVLKMYCLRIFLHMPSKAYVQGVTTLTRPILGEKQNSSMNLEILSGIRRLRNFSGKYDSMGYCCKKSSLTLLQDCHWKNREDLANF